MRLPVSSCPNTAETKDSQPLVPRRSRNEGNSPNSPNRGEGLNRLPNCIITTGRLPGTVGRRHHCHRHSRHKKVRYFSLFFRGKLDKQTSARMKQCRIVSSSVDPGRTLETGSRGSQIVPPISILAIGRTTRNGHRHLHHSQEVRYFLLNEGSEICNRC